MSITNPLEKRLSYSIGMKINVGNYQSVDVHLSESTAFSTEGLSQDDIDIETEQEYKVLREKVDQRFVDAVNEVKESFTT